MKKAFITGLAGQDSSYLAEFLLKKGYEVHGTRMWDSVLNTWRIDHLLHPKEKIHLYHCDMTDSSRIQELIRKIQPDEVYNLGSMSHVRVSFDMPEYTGNVTGLGVCRMLEAVRQAKPDAKFYQASSSEMFGSSPAPQNEDTPFQPQSPYGCAKLYGYWMTKTYRKGYNMFASNGILFNHESPRRGETFVTRKIIRGAVAIKQGKEKTIELGNLDAKRDWGFAGDYVEAMWLILQQEKPDDFVIATEEFYSVREFAEKVFKKLGLDFYEYLVTNERFYRPNEVPELRGDATKARKVLGWKPKVGFDELVEMMIENEGKH
ncbi:MAG TPA: GDP-mannose 4,6-dehydratase [bacterium]|nr:GDP-mannose 4,6-dehydratase [bacterium]